VPPELMVLTGYPT